MKRMFIAGGLALSISVAFGPVAFGQAGVTLPSLESQAALVEQYCSGCHNDVELAGNMSLTQLDLEDVDQNSELAEKFVRKLRAGLMPPAGAPRPEAANLNAFAAALENGLDTAAAIEPYVDVPELHRVNRTEYGNAVRDLLDLEVDVAGFLPRDAITGGFDNMADALTVTPALMQGYMRAAETIARLAVGDVTAPTSMVSYSVPKVENQLGHIEGTPFGTRGGSAILHNFPADGEYSFKVDLYHWYTGSLIGYRLPENLEEQQIDVSIDGTRVALIDIDPGIQDFDGGMITEPVHIKAGPRRVAVAFVSKFDGPVEDRYWLVDQTLVDVSIANHPGMSSLPHLQTFSITGPIDPSGVSETPSRRAIFTCRPTDASMEASCAEEIISRLARGAFRRPVVADDMESLMEFYREGYEDGGFEVGVRMSLQALLAKPEFVFRFERLAPGVAPGETFAVTDLELASRLSFFLWSSAPDDELISLAEAGRLGDSTVLRQQVERMLEDPRSEALTANFAGQWLRLKGIEEVHPEGLTFPNFTRTLARAMRQEIELFFDSVVREDRSVFDLLTGDYTFVNQVLAEHYGIPNVAGTQFQRVPVTDPNRIGLIGKAGWLTMTSLASRTSPVQRGKYVLEVLVGTPPPNPPAAVPPLEESARNEKLLSVRERMEQHRANPACSACHKIMDPIGLALENFDPVGRWRSVDSGASIDAKSTMYDGTELDGPVGVREAVLGHPEAFIRNFAEKLLSYGLGRVLDHRDMPTVRSIARAAASNDNRFSSFVMGIVESPAFQMSKRPTSEE
jgi:hypothetical protein